ncbi:hypothetical protein D6745_04225 [Candidatus Woesearchaeota archaeon]|nr:MAG: hypothetical protein D6745_04225 [Candidatus Woesearchaeota archaeon]
MSRHELSDTVKKEEKSLMQRLGSKLTLVLGAAALTALTTFSEPAFAGRPYRSCRRPPTGRALHINRGFRHGFVQYRNPIGSRYSPSLRIRWSNSFWFWRDQRRYLGPSTQIIIPHRPRPPAPVRNTIDITVREATIIDYHSHTNGPAPGTPHIHDGYDWHVHYVDRIHYFIRDGEIFHREEPGFIVVFKPDPKKGNRSLWGYFHGRYDDPTIHPSYPDHGHN